MPNLYEPYDCALSNVGGSDYRATGKVDIPNGMTLNLKSNTPEGDHRNIVWEATGSDTGGTQTVNLDSGVYTRQPGENFVDFIIQEGGDDKGTERTSYL